MSSSALDGLYDHRQQHHLLQSQFQPQHQFQPQQHHHHLVSSGVVAGLSPLGAAAALSRPGLSSSISAPPSSDTAHSSPLLHSPGAASFGLASTPASAPGVPSPLGGPASTPGSASSLMEQAIASQQQVPVASTSSAAPHQQQHAFAGMDVDFANPVAAQQRLDAQGLASVQQQSAVHQGLAAGTSPQGPAQPQRLDQQLHLGHGFPPGTSAASSARSSFQASPAGSTMLPSASASALSASGTGILGPSAVPPQRHHPYAHARPQAASAPNSSASVPLSLSTNGLPGTQPSSTLSSPVVTQAPGEGVYDAAQQAAVGLQQSSSSRGNGMPRHFFAISSAASSQPSLAAEASSSAVPSRLMQDDVAMVGVDDSSAPQSNHSDKSGAYDWLRGLPSQPGDDHAGVRRAQALIDSAVATSSATSSSAFSPSRGGVNSDRGAPSSYFDASPFVSPPTSTGTTDPGTFAHVGASGLNGVGKPAAVPSMSTGLPESPGMAMSLVQSRLAVLQAALAHSNNNGSSFANGTESAAPDEEDVWRAVDGAFDELRRVMHARQTAKQQHASVYSAAPQNSAPAANAALSAGVPMDTDATLTMSSGPPTSGPSTAQDRMLAAARTMTTSAPPPLLHTKSTPTVPLASSNVSSTSGGRNVSDPFQRPGHALSSNGQQQPDFFGGAVTANLQDLHPQRPPPPQGGNSDSQVIQQQQQALKDAGNASRLHQVWAQQQLEAQQQGPELGMNQHVAPSMISGSAQPFHTFMPQSAPVSPMRSHPSEPQSTVSHMAIRAPDAAIKLDDAFMRDLNTLQNASVADSTTDSRSRGSTQSWASNPILAAAAAPPLPSGSVEATLRGIQAPAPSPMPASSAPPAAGQATAAAKGPTSRSRAPSASADGGKRSRAASSAAPPVDGRRSRAASTSKAADAATSRQGVREDDLLDELEDDGEGAANATKSFGLASMATVEPELKAVMDPIFLEFLADICSNLDATDSRGDHIHQTLMAKKMMKLDESDDFRPFKFRIQAFTSAFIERLLERGFEEGQIPLKKVRQYLWTQNYISRYNEDGKKAKSKGNHIWTIEAKKMGDRKWMFREFTRCLKGAAPTVAYVDEEWSWSPRIWCPQSSTAGIQAHFTSPALPSWLSWEEGTLTGVAPESDLGMTYEVTAIVTYERGDQLERLEASALFKVCTQDQSAEELRPDRSAVQSLAPSQDNTPSSRAESPAPQQMETHPEEDDQGDGATSQNLAPRASYLGYNSFSPYHGMEYGSGAATTTTYATTHGLGAFDTPQDSPAPLQVQSQPEYGDMGALDSTHAHLLANAQGGAQFDPAQLATRLQQESAAQPYADLGGGGAGDPAMYEQEMANAYMALNVHSNTTSGLATPGGDPYNVASLVNGDDCPVSIDPAHLGR